MLSNPGVKTNCLWHSKAPGIEKYCMNLWLAGILNELLQRNIPCCNAYLRGIDQIWRCAAISQTRNKLSIGNHQLVRLECSLEISGNLLIMGCDGRGSLSAFEILHMS